MGKQGTSVVGTVILTTCVTSGLMFGGWFVATHYLGQDVVPSTHAETAVEARHPKIAKAKKDLRRAPENKDADASTDAPTNVLAAAESEAARRSDESGASSAAARDPEGIGDIDTAGKGGDGEASSGGRAIAALAGAAISEDPRAIMAEAQRRTEATSYQYEGLLQSFDSKAKVTEKRWTFERLGSHGKSKAVLRFTAPAEVKGVALLIVNHPDRASDQWMWTPAIERDRRIALQDRSTRFFGTDFSFEDLEERDVDQYDYSMLGDETIEGQICWKIQTTPKQSRSSQYSRSIVWVRKDNYAVARLDNFVKDEVVRRLNYSSIESIQDIWTARLLEMADLRRGSRTRLTLQQVKYNVPMKEESFTLDAIRR